MTRFRLLRSFRDDRSSGAKTLLWPGHDDKKSQR
jgi:hypothetical protein